MRNIGSLLYVQFLRLHLVDLFRKSKTSRKISIVFLAFFLSLIFLPLAVSMVISPALVLAQFDARDTIPAVSVSLSSVALFIFALLRVKLLFSADDWQLLASLPIKRWHVIFSKVLFLYCLLLGLNLLIMLPPTVLWYLWEPTLNVMMFILMLLVIILTPLIPLMLAVYTGIFFSRFNGRFKVFNAKTLFGFIIVMLSNSYLFLPRPRPEDIESGIATYIEYIKAVAKIYPPAWLLSPNIIPSFYIGSISFILLSLAIFVPFIQYVSKHYIQLNEALTRETIITKKIRTQHQKKSKLQALLTKEVRLFFSSPATLLQTGTAYIMILVFCGVFIFGTPSSFIDLSFSIEEVIPNISLDELSIFYIYLFGFFLAVLANYAASSLSLEGKELWIIQTSPFSFSSILQAKFLLTIALQAIPLVILSIIFFLTNQPPLLNMLFFVAWLISYCLFSTAVGLFLNFLFPKYNWKSDVEVVKQSAPIQLSSLVHFILIPVFAVWLFLSFQHIYQVLTLQITMNTILAGGLLFWLSQQQLYVKAK